MKSLLRETRSQSHFMVIRCQVKQYSDNFHTTISDFIPLLGHSGHTTAQKWNTLKTQEQFYTQKLTDN